MNKFDSIVDEIIKSWGMSIYVGTSTWEFANKEKRDSIINSYIARRSNRIAAMAVIDTLKKLNVITWESI